ncbi:MAG: DUF4124 domain-containing protein [Gammaproteobacteria bacterium]
MQRSTLMLILVLAAPLTLSAAGVYKWVDAEGKVHYSDRPGNAAAEQVPLKAAPPPDPTRQQRQEKTNKFLQIREDERKQSEEDAVKAKQTQKEREQQCLHAKAKLRDYERARYLYNPEEGDKETILSDAERNAATGEVKKSIEELCD